MGYASRSGVSPHVYDCIGVGFGPANIALAISMEERGILENSLFLESKDEIAWHPDMMMPGSDIQHNPLRDLVTPRNPASKYGFLSYLKEKKRLFDYLNLDAPYPPRSEYNEYVRWVGMQFQRHVRLSKRVASVSITKHPDFGQVVNIKTSDGEIFIARTLSFAPGRSVNIPAAFASYMGEKVIHLERYLSAVAEWGQIKKDARIGVIGGSQSAIEIVLDLIPKFPGGQIINICRGFGFKQKDLSPFTEAIYYPEFVDYYHSAPHDVQRKITNELKRSNYSAADHDVIAALNFQLYEQKVLGRSNVSLKFCKQIADVNLTEGGEFSVSLRDVVNGAGEDIALDFIILATGYKNFGSGEGSEPIHPILQGISSHVVFRPDGGVDVERDYRLVPKNRNGGFPRVFVNGLCESTHGFGDAGSFSLLSLRADTIARSIEEALIPTDARLEAAQ